MTISSLTKIGLALESTWGDADAPVICLPVEPPSITEPYEQILDNLQRGIYAMDFGAYQGPGHVEMSLAGHFYPEELGFLLAAMIGLPSSGTAVPYEHTFTMSTTQPPSLAIQDEGAVYVTGSKRRFSGMLPSSFVLSFSSAEGVLAWSCDLMGKRGTSPGTGDTPSAVGTSPFLGWQAGLTIGTASNTTVIDAEITLEREVEMRHGSDGTQYPVAGHSGALSVTATMTIDATATELGYALGHSTNALVFTFTNGEASTALRSLVVTIPQFNWGEAPAELDRSGIFITLGASGRGLYDDSASYKGPIKVVLKSARATYVSA